MTIVRSICPVSGRPISMRLASTEEAVAEKEAMHSHRTAVRQFFLEILEKVKGGK
jgi:hypothetical protein